MVNALRGSQQGRSAGAFSSGSAADGADEADGDKESDKKEENGNEGSVVRIVTLV